MFLTQLNFARSVVADIVLGSVVTVFYFVEVLTVVEIALRMWKTTRDEASKRA